MSGEDLRKDLKELRDRLDALREALARVAGPYREVAGYIAQLQEITRGYFRILDLYARYGAISPDLAVPGLKDDISRHIVSALFEQGDRNISQVAEAVKAKRGTASRRIVRERLARLEDRGVVVSAPGAKGRTFRVSDEIATRWARILLPSSVGTESRDGPRTEAP